MSGGHGHRNLPAFGSPNKDSPWASVQEKAQELTKERIDTWRDSDLSNLLIFASLFSTILTAFTIDARRNVQINDPVEKTVLLLQTLVFQVSNLTNPQANLQFDLTPTVVITPHAQHIYLLYSVSLTLSFFAVLGGILCLQWLRESSKHMNGASNNNELYLQYQRHRSLQGWGVMALINLLELLLLASLFLFFAAFLISQWESETLAAIPVTVLVAIAVLFTLVTSCLPTIQAVWLTGYNKPSLTMLELADEPQPPVLCPYRSLQAWFVHSTFQYIYSFAMRYILHKDHDVQDKQWSTLLYYANNWTHYDAWWAQKQHRERDPQSLFSALFWVVGQVRQSKDVVLAVYQCFVSSTADMFSDYLASLSESSDGEVSDDVWTAFGFSMLSVFEEEFIIDVLERNVVWKIRLWLFSEIWSELKRCNRQIRDSSSLYRIFGLGVIAEKSDKELLKVVHSTLEDSASTWITDESAVAVTCHVVRQGKLHFDIWCETIPVLITLCNRYQKGVENSSLEHIDKLCTTLRKRLSRKSSHNAALIIFNGAFPVVDDAHLDDLGVTIGNLLKCDSEQCSIFPGFAIKFLEIIESLVRQPHIVQKRSLDDIILYTAHVIEHSYNPSIILPSIHSTFDAILLAVQHYLSLANHSTDFVLHPSRLSIGRPIWDEEDGPVWPIIDAFNKKLKGLWSPRDGEGCIVGGIHDIIESESVVPQNIEPVGPDSSDQLDENGSRSRTTGSPDVDIVIIPETQSHENDCGPTPPT